ncbi:MAG: CDP-diacylglycerol--serine O-phosphatidyltransferase [Bacteroidetes bacterium]|nr:CDP-diacylglycerol--serine O-phosphatidyltransferase [Bacteroidota bacterium]
MSKKYLIIYKNIKWHIKNYTKIKTLIILMKKHIPNLLTLFNLVSGCLGIIEALNGNLYTAEKYMWLGMILDFLDGYVARLLKSSSSLGKELDSFADLVTSSILPCMMIYITIKNGLDINYKYDFYYYLHNTAFIIPALAALRLAKFNLDDSQTYHFKGMPTPACALLLASLTTLDNSIILKKIKFMNDPLFLSLISIFCSLLLISNIKFIAFKFKGYKWSKNKLRYFFATIAIILFITMKKEGVVLSLILYIIIAFIQTINDKLKKSKT